MCTESGFVSYFAECSLNAVGVVYNDALQQRTSCERCFLIINCAVRTHAVIGKCIVGQQHWHERIHTGARAKIRERDTFEYIGLTFGNDLERFCLWFVVAKARFVVDV